MPKEPLLFTYWLLRHSVFWFTPIPIQSVRQPLVTYPSLCGTCVTNRTPCHSIGHQVLPTQPSPRDAQDFPRGCKHCKHVSPLTYPACLQSVSNNLRLIFKKTKNSSHINQQSWISSHFNQLPKVILNLPCSLLKVHQTNLFITAFAYTCTLFVQYS